MNINRITVMVCDGSLWWSGGAVTCTNPIKVSDQGLKKDLDQGWATSDLEGRCPAEFRSNPNQTHLNQLIKVFKITRKLPADVFE